jgi:hypothetical protein
MRPGGVNLPKDFNPKDKQFKKFANKLPTKENCDLTNPKEMFLWMLVALPGQNGGQQAMPSSYNMLVSEHLHACGAMLQCPNCGHTKDAEKQYVPPSAEDPHWMTSPGRWVKPDEVPEPNGDPLDTVLDAMPNQQQAALFERLKRRHEKGQI